MVTIRVSRRAFVAGAGLSALGFALGFTARSLLPSAGPSGLAESAVTSPDQALRRLLDGNGRFAAGNALHPGQSVEEREKLVSGQHPWAMILSCVDSRVPTEIVFDQGLGEMFVARTAGQVIDDAVLGSIEFAVQYGVKLVMVMGHENCGAVDAAIKVFDTGKQPGGQIAALTDAIMPAVKIAKAQSGDVLDNAIRANVVLETASLKQSSDIISSASQQGKISIVGAYYSLRTGRVDVLPASLTVRSPA